MEPDSVSTTTTRPVTPPSQNWTYWDVGLVAVFALFVQIPLGLAGFFVLRLARVEMLTLADAMTHPSFILPVQFVWSVLVFWLIYRVVRARDSRPFRDAIGWVRPALPAGLYLGSGALLALAVAGLAALLPKTHHRMPIELLFRDPASAFLLAGFGVLIAPPVEELLFRGFLYPVVERAHGALVAVVGTAVVFAMMHGQQYAWAWQNLVLLSFAGTVFGAVRAVSGSLVPSTLVHAAYNLTLFVGLYATSDRFRNFNF